MSGATPPWLGDETCERWRQRWLIVEAVLIVGIGGGFLVWFMWKTLW